MFWCWILRNICNSKVGFLMGTFCSGRKCTHAVLSDNGTLVANTLSSCNLKLFCCLCLLSFLIIAEIDNSLGILQNCKMTKVTKICDRYIVWLLVQLGAESHFRDALIVEQILYFTIIWDLHCTLLLIILTIPFSWLFTFEHFMFTCSTPWAIINSSC